MFTFKYIKNLGLCLTIALVVIMGFVLPATGESNAYFYYPELYNSIQLGIDDGDPEIFEAYKDLNVNADKALARELYSVMDKALVPASGDKHDYFSIGIYWWPNPDTQDGLPYIQKDGQVNPETKGPESDASRLVDFTDDVWDLASFYYHSHQEKYAVRAAELIRHWFLNPATLMNPNMQYSQAVPGIADGRSFGIIQTRSFSAVIDAVGIIKDSPAWTDEDHQGIKAWFTDYNTWLLTDTLGIEEGLHVNNHGTWYDAQVIQFALFTGDTQTARTIIEAAKENRIGFQIDSLGVQHEAMERTNALHYHAFNLDALLRLARLAEFVGIDLWSYTATNGGSLQKALNFIAPYGDPDKDWPHAQISSYNRVKLLPLLRHGAAMYEDAKFEEFIAKLPSEDRMTHPMNLILPRGYYPNPIVPIVPVHQQENMTSVSRGGISYTMVNGGIHLRNPQVGFKKFRTFNMLGQQIYLPNMKN